ncbi:MAG TPA: hypothetical protein VEY92_13140 [Pseudoxanthomonas sp.]|nr:hypothetical protein [Pseudoxanthomonas sp.]
MRADLFPGTKPPRAKPRVMMRFIDVGTGAASELIATFACRKCGHETDWLICANATDVKRGEPCPICNRGET